MNKNQHRWTETRVSLLCGAIFLSAVPGMAGSARAADAFAPKSITIVIPAEADNGTDNQVARLGGRFLSKYLPGQPTVVYLNVPGGSGIKALNDFVVKAKPDGLTSVVASASNIDPSTLRNPAVRFNAKQFQMYGGFPAPNGVLILRKDAVARFNDRALNPAIMGDVTAVRNVDQMAVWGPNYLGWNVRWVLGYKGSSEMVLAAIRGEIDMIVTYNVNFIKQLRDTGLFIIPVQTGVMGDSKLVASPEFPDTPVFSDLVRPLLKDPLEMKAFASWESLTQIGKWFALPPNTPKDILDIYREAFAKSMKDGQFVDEAHKILGDNVAAASGDDIERVADVADTVSDDELKFFNRLREKVGIRMEQ